MKRIGGVFFLIVLPIIFVLFITYKDKTPAKPAEEIQTQTNINHEDIKKVDENTNSASNTYKLDVSDDNSQFTDPKTQRQYPNVEYRALLTPNDSLYSSQWHLAKISAPIGWDISTGSSSATIAVVDTGFGLNHQDLNSKWATNSLENGPTIQEGPAPNCTSQALTLDKSCNNLDDDSNGLVDDWRGWDFENSDNDPNAGTQDPSNIYVSHGTQTSGAAAATTNNTLGVSGVNWGAKILPIQALGDNGSGFTSTVGVAIRYAADQNVDIISLSLGSSQPDDYLLQQIDYAISKGIIVVAASGNDGCNCMDYPANYSQVVGVGATDASDNRANFSSYGNSLDIMAPGVSIVSTTWSQANQTSGYNTSGASGTSMSTPIVAASLANLKFHNQGASTNTVVQALLQGADKLAQMNGQSQTSTYGFGRTNINRSLMLVAAPTGDWPTIINYICSSGSTPTNANSIYFQKTGGKDYANLLVYSPTSTNCVESHVWNTGMQTWREHIATNQSVVQYPNLQTSFGDLDGSGSDYPVLFGVSNTSTNKIEAHVWNKNMRSYLVHAASNQAAIDPADCKIIIADLDGDQREDPILVCLRNTSTGKIEYHTWNPGMQTWRNHVATNMPVVDPAIATVVAGDIDGNGADELILAAYSSTGSNKVEFHVWNSGQQSWWYHIVTNLDPVDSTKGKIEFADTDGNKVDDPVFIKFADTGSGKIEFHTWNPGYYSWRSNIASNQPTL